jgi:hypothetical protein
MNNDNNISVAIRIDTGKADIVLMRQLKAVYPEGIVLKPKDGAGVGDLGRFIPAGSIIYADFVQKDIKAPPASCVKATIKLKAGYIFNGAVILTTEQGIYINERPLDDELAAVKYIPFQSISYIDYAVKNDLVLLDLNNIDDSEPAAEPEPAAASC